MAGEPYSGIGRPPPDFSGYQILDPVSKRSSSSGSNSDTDYDYPTDPAASLIYCAEADITKQQPQSTTHAQQAAAPAPAIAMSDREAILVLTSGVSKAVVSQLVSQDVLASEQPPQDSFSSSEGDSSDPEVPLAGPPVIRQTPSLASSITGSGQVSGSKMERSPVSKQGDEKLFLTGNLMGSQKDGTGSSTKNNQFTEEGIYQGLVMTDKQKKNIGILPESIYMTNNLIEKRDLIESLSLDSIPATAVEVPEVPFPPNSPSIFSKDTLIVTDTIPKIPPPKLPIRGKGKLILNDAYLDL